jgi:hypothetical protein
VNALSEDAYVFAEVDGKYGVFTLRELFEIHKKGRSIKVPTLLNERGEKTWVEVEDIISFGKQPLKRITLATTRLYAELTEDSIIPAFGLHLFEAEIEKINLKFKLANELKVSQDPRRNNSLLLAIHIPLHIPEGDQKDYDYGFALGYWLAEGSIKRRKRKNTKHSLATLNWYAKQKGMTLDEYLEHMTDIQWVFLAVGYSDFERGYIQILQKHFKFSKPRKYKNSNGYQLYSSDLNYIHLIKDYIVGSDSHKKHLKNEAFNRTKKFLEGIMDGFLCGDGHFAKQLDGFQVNMTANYKLRDDLIFLSKALGYDAHINNGRFEKSPSSNNYYYHLRLNIFKTYHRRTALGLVKEHLRSVEDVGEREAFNLVLKPIYSQDEKRTKFNHLYFTAYGLLVSDALKTLEPLNAPHS